MNGDYPKDCPIVQTSPKGINTNTYVSFGVIGAIVVVALWINNSISEAKTAVTTAKTEITSRMDKSDTTMCELAKRMDRFESNKETWSSQDMFRWCVHLQRDNDGSNGSVKLKVPEPESGK